MEVQFKVTCRANLTKLIKSADDFFKDSEMVNVSDLNVLIDRVKAAKDMLKTATKDAMVYVDGDRMIEECQKIFDYEDSAVECIAKLEQLKVRFQERRPLSPANSNVNVQGQEQTADEVNRTGIQVINKKRAVKLPTISLLNFNGDMHAWPQFWEQYCLHIHENIELDDSEKFCYLKSLLTGPAALIIEGLTTSQASYQDAIDILKEEYGKTEYIVDEYIQKLLSLPIIKNKNDVSALKNLYNNASIITRSLQSLGVSAEHYGIMVQSVLFKALPYQMKIDFNKHLANESLDNKLGSEHDIEAVVSDITDNFKDNLYSERISKLLKFIKLEIDSLSRAQAISNNSQEAFVEKRGREKPFERTYSKNKNKVIKPCTAAGLLTTANESNCLFCKEKGHQMATCLKQISIEMKKHILKKNGCCFKCTKLGHNSQRCFAKVICEKCKNRHATSMCDPNFIVRKHNDDANGNAKNSVLSKPSTSSVSSTNLFTSNAHSCAKHGNPVYLQTAYSFINSENNENRAIRIVLDGGSQMTFIKECVSRQLNLPVVGIHKISIVAFGHGQQTPSRVCRKVLLNLKSCVTNEVVQISAVEVPEICFDTLEVPCLDDSIIKHFAMKYKLADVVPDSNNIFPGISVLIGADNYSKLVTGERRQLTENLCALKTKFGWTLLGVNERETESVNFNLSTILHVRVEKDEEMDLKRFWNLETIGIINEKERESVSTAEFMRDKIIFKDNRYHVSLPWINEHFSIDSNLNGAQTRLKNLINKLIRNGSLIEYDKVMREYFENDIAELVQEPINSERQYFMPHRPVYREDKESTKIRIVFDASAHAPQLPSLNELLHSGENLVPDLVRILLNFRIGAYALIADVEKAFLQVALEENERNSHCFLWFDEMIRDSKNLPNLVKYRMKRVTFGVTCSPFLLVATLQKHLMSQDEKFKRTCDIISNSFYVDDLVVAVNSKEMARMIFDDSTTIMSKANMNLRKWCSNDDGINKYIRTKGLLCNLMEHDSYVKKVLGIQWNTYSDEINVDLTKLNSANCRHIFSKRIILQTIASVYDPLGFLGPFTIKAKIIMQQIWKANFGWDDILTDETSNDWLIWVNDTKNLYEYYIPRCIIADNRTHAELHVFTDASPQAYGAVAYLRNCISNEIKSCNFLISKNRVAPINTKMGQNSLTLPKLELTAALCGARLQKYILDNVNVTFKNVFLWSDSKITLFWIKGKPSRWKPYVSNRVIEINNISKGVWRHCPGHDNPADLLTRGISAEKLKNSSVWMHGPDWLLKTEMHWPELEENFFVKEEEIIASFGVEVLTDHSDTPIFELTKYSNLDKIIRITCYVFRFLYNLKHKAEKRTTFLSINEMKLAEMYWIRNTQQKAFNEEINCLNLKRNLSKNSSLLVLNPFLDENRILRLGGRLQESLLPYENRHPILLPKNLYLTNLIIWRTHFNNCHLGVNSTLACIRKKYWILQGRQNVKSVLSKCVACRKLRGKSGNEPFAYLPASRVRQANPFKICGIDFAGPLYLVTGNDKRTKAYILLITCATVRAVHLELVEDLTSESCLRALRRFIARRGVPDIIYSDNAKTFVRVSKEFKELEEMTKTAAVQDHTRKYGIEWRFNVERAPWWGGFWERLVKTVKDSLKVTIGKSSLTSGELSTVLVEVEAIVNSRPLTYIDDDPENLLILSPSHFLLGSAETNFTFDFQNSQVLKRSDMLQKWNIRNKLLSKFWNKWKNDYLQQLRSAHVNRVVKSLVIKMGDVVLLYEPNINRLLWKMARVTEVFFGRDGRARACQVRTADGTYLKRPIQLLYPMELDKAAGEDVKN